MKTMRFLFVTFVLLIATLAPLTAQIVPGEARAIVPVVGSTKGAFGANFKTELQLHNPGAGTMTGSLVFRPAGQPGTVDGPSLAYELAPFETQHFADVVAQMGGDGLGSLDIIPDTGSKLPTAVFRAFDDKDEAGTTGVTVPMVLVSKALTAGKSAALIVPADLVRFRFNIGVRSLSDGAILNVKLYNADGSLAADLGERGYPGNYFEQRSANAFLGVEPQPDQSVLITMVSGRAIVYGTTTDNKTNDGSVQLDEIFNSAPTVADPAGDGSLLIVAQTTEGEPVMIAAAVSDEDGDAITYTLGSGPSNGTVGEIIETETGFTIVYTPEDGFLGEDEFTITIGDGEDSITLTIRIIVTEAGNNLPTANAGAVSTPEGVPVDVTLTGSDPDDDGLTFAISTVPSNGTLSSITAINGTSARVTYTPNAGFSGVDTFEFSVDDGRGGIVRAIVTVTVTTEANTAPVATNQTVSTSLETPVAFVLMASDADGDPLSYTILTNPANGALSGTAPNLTYTPNPGFSGPDSFTWRVSDGRGGSDTATVSLEVAAAGNSAPVATDDSVTTAEDTAVSFTLIAADPDGDALSYVIMATPSNGSLSGTAPNLTYTPQVDFNGSDSFTFRVNDGNVSSNVATVSITVTPVNDAPVADGQSVTTAEDTPVAIVLTGSDIDGNALSFIVATNPTSGVLSGTAPNLTYTPNTNFNGSDSFTFRANDGASNSAAATVLITVTPVNDVPVALDDAYVVDEGGALNIVTPGVLGNDTDVESALTATLVADVANGALVLNADGSFSYVHNGSETTTDSFTYTATDGTAVSNVATVAITINPVNDAPVIDLDQNDSEGTAGSDFAITFTEDDPATLLEDAADAVITDVDHAMLASLTVTLTNLLDAGDEMLDANPGATPITKNYDTTTPGVGVLTLTGPATIAEFESVLRTVTYQNTSDNPDTTARAITFVANDGTDPSDPAVSTVTIVAENDAPVADDATFNVDENSTNGTAVGTVSASDVDGDALSYAITGGTGATAFAIDAATGEITVADTAQLDFETTPSFTLTVEVTDDGTGNLTDTATITINLNDVDDAPEAVDDAATVTEDDPATTIDVLANDTDVDGGPISIQSVTQPANGSVAITNAGADVSYTSNANYCNNPPGTTLDSFNYTLNGGSSATVTVTVTCVDDDPTAVADAATVAEDSGATAIDVLANDTDPDGGPISISSVTQPANGAVVITGGGSGLTYTPNANYCNNPPGTTLDTFTYTLTPGGSSTTVTVTVTCVDDDPVAVADTATVVEDSGANAIDVLANDTDADGGTIEVQSVTQAANGAVAISGGGTGVTYTPNANYCNNPPGSTLDTFTYTLNGGSSTTVTVTVTCVEDPPTAVADAVTVIEDSGANTINVQGNDTDPDGGTNTVQSVTQPTNGTVAITNAGADLSYTPNANYCNDPPGTLLESFTYTLNGGSSTTVTVTVTCVNDPPVAGADAFDFIGNTELRVDLAAASTPHALETTSGGFGLLENDSDPVEGDLISIVGLTVGACVDNSAPYDCTDPAVGRVQLDASGSFSFVPAAGDAGATETFQYTLSDGTDTAVGTVTLTRYERVWYVKNDAAAGGNGTSTSPFNAITAANLNDNDADADLTDDLDAANDYIFVYFGDGTTTGQSSGLFLEGGQHLIGEHAGLTLPIGINGNGSTTTLVAAAAGSRPLFDDTVADGFDGVYARDVVPAEIVGLNLAGNVNGIDWTTTAAFAGSGSFSIRDNVVRSAGAEGVDVNLVGTGAVRLAFHDNTITSTGTALDIQETGIGSLTISAFDDLTVNGDTGGSGIVVNNAIFDSVAGGGLDTVSGGTTNIGASGNGVGLSGMTLTNVQGDLHFTNLNIYADSGSGLSVTGAGVAPKFRVNTGGAATGVIQAINGPAVSASTIELDLRLVDMDSTNSTSQGASLTNVTGTFSAESGSAISNATGTDFLISGGTANVTYKGTITDDVGQLVSVSGATGGTKAFEGAITDGDDGDGSGISLSTNGGATIRFSGGLVLSTGGNAAFAATGGGTLAICDENPCNGAATGGLINKITTTTGTALNVSNVAIGNQNLEFRSISAGTGASGPASGISLNDTGGLGGLKIKGTGAAGSGGTIQRTTGPGISLTSTQNVDLSYMAITDGGDDGIRGNTLNNLNLTSVSVTSNGNAVGETGIELLQLTGSGTMSNVTVSGSADNNVVIANTTGTLSSLNVTNSSFTTTNMTTGDDGFRIENNGSGAMTVSITGSTFTDNKGDHFQVATSAGATGSINFTFSNNTLSTTPANDPNVIGGGITISPSGSADVSFTIDNNNVQQAFDEAINLNLGTASTAAASMIGTVSNNIVGTAGTADSGSESGSGISVISNGAGYTRVAVTGNTVHQYANPYGILLMIKEGTSSMDATVTGNTVANPGSFAINGIRVDAGATTGDNGTLCVTLTGNTVAGSGPGADTDIRLRQRFNTTIRLPGYAGANNDTTAVNAFVAGNNAGADVSSAHNVGGGGGGFVGGAACATP